MSERIRTIAPHVGSKDAISLTLKQRHVVTVGGQVGVGEVPRLLVVVLHLQRLHVREVNAQGATTIVDVVPIEALWRWVSGFGAVG